MLPILYLSTVLLSYDLSPNQAFTHFPLFHAMRIYAKTSKRTVVLVSKTHALLFKHVNSYTGPRILVEMTSSANINTSSLKSLSLLDIHGFIGLIEVQDLIYLVTITSKYQVATPLENQSVDKILNVEFFCLNSSKYDDLTINNNTDTVSNDEYTSDSLLVYHPCSDFKKFLSDGSFYYSTNFDLTNNLQTRGINDNSLSIDTYQDEYMWNSFMMSEMIQFRNKSSDQAKKTLDANGFLTTVIRGFAKTLKAYVGEHHANLSIISRQSWKRAGTRYNARGIDDEGNVANFVETEIILHIFDKIVCSFVQIRGSIPVFWEQDSLLSLSTPKVQITRSKEATEPVFLKHFQSLLEKYHVVHVVNLLSRKTNETELSQRYKDHILMSQEGNTVVTTDNTLLTEFDFHQQTKGANYSSAARILNYIHDSVEKFDYFSYSFDQNKVLTKQEGVFRTNCLDCLDRTNLTQQVIASDILKLILVDYNLHGDSLRTNDLLQTHNTLWADNGDQISQMYTGTNALKSSFSRSGKMTIGLLLSDATKSVTRMYQNNFVDKNKQVTIDALLGRTPGQKPVILYDPVNENVESHMKELENKYTHESVKSIYCGTFNLNGKTLNDAPSTRKEYESMLEWLMPDNNSFYGDTPDVYILGFQEVIELNASNILNADYSKSSLWQKAIGNLLNSISPDGSVKYSLIRAEQMASLLLLFFAKSTFSDKITQVEGFTKKTGLGGIAGNKGAIAIRFDIGATSYCAINSHLASGQLAILERNNDYLSIANSIYFSRGGKVFNHDNIIWLGDLNYRINLANENVRSAVASDNIHLLLANDQLLSEIQAKNAFQNFEEKEITFLPTYKFDNGTDNYDTSEKQRAPSWTDRILYRGSLNPLAYDSVGSIKFSDHKPVYCLFESNVKFVNDKLKNQMYNSLYKDFKESLKIGDVSYSLVDVVNDRNMSSSPRPLPKRSNTVSESTSTGNLLDFDTSTPSASIISSGTTISTENSVLSSDKKNEAPAPPASRRATTTTTTFSSAPPPVPTLRKTSVNKSPESSTPPPGFSQAILQPKSKVTPTPSPKPQPPKTLASMAQALELQKLSAKSSANSSTVSLKNSIASPKPTPAATGGFPPGFLTVLIASKKNSESSLSLNSQDLDTPKKKAPPPIVPKKPKNLHAALSPTKPTGPK